MSDIQRLGVIGGGFMGSGIAESCARAGLEVVVYEPEAAPLERSRGTIQASIETIRRRVDAETRVIT